MRVFFALWPGPVVRAAIHQRTSEIALPQGRPVRRENLHATLLFVGVIEPEKLPELRAAAAAVRAPAFAITLDTAGQFRHAGVAWLGAAELPAAGTRLVAALREVIGGAGFAFDPRPFRLHVTIARDVIGRWVPPAVPPVVWPVDAFALVESVTRPEGAVYQILESWPLAPAGSDETAAPTMR